MAEKELMEFDERERTRGRKQDGGKRKWRLMKEEEHMVWKQDGCKTK